MKRYLLDTNILLHALKKDNFWSKISEELEIDQAQNFISVVSIGELYALALRNNWGEERTHGTKLLAFFCLTQNAVMRAFVLFAVRP